jgi:hypothetical protein
LCGRNIFHTRVGFTGPMNFYFSFEFFFSFYILFCFYYYFFLCIIWCVKEIFTHILEVILFEFELSVWIGKTNFVWQEKNFFQVYLGLKDCANLFGIQDFLLRKHFFTKFLKKHTMQKKLFWVLKLFLVLQKKN